MKSVRQVSDLFRKELQRLYPVNEAASLSMLVLNEITGLSSAKIKAFPEFEITAGQAKTIINILSRLKTGEPVQYILGHTEFYGLPIKVNPSVLIPRPETEELVEWAICSARNSKGGDVSILDIGTGSGCIAVSLKKNLHGAHVTAIDISSAALLTARENAERNAAEINFFKADMLTLSGSRELDGPYSLIISNPPYVTLDDKKQMHINVTKFEPHSALFVPKDDPLIFYKAIADFSAGHLKKEGLVFLEINESYGEQIVDLFSVKLFTDIELKKDMSGKFRMIKAVLGPSCI